jgi:hypothetical protein
MSLVFGDALDPAQVSQDKVILTLGQPEAADMAHSTALSSLNADPGSVCWSDCSVEVSAYAQKLRLVLTSLAGKKQRISSTMASTTT